MSLLGLDREAAVYVQASRLKTAAPFVLCSGFELPVTTRIILGWPFRFEVGEFMRSFIAIAAACAALAGCPALAEDAASQQPTRIEIDQNTKAFVFIIDDEPVAMLDKAGLHVVGEVNYGATLTDNGAEHIKKQIASTRTEAADE